MSKFLFNSPRKSFMTIGEIYFWTATINQWQKLLLRNSYKDVIINSLSYLNDLGLVDVFGFVIMPTHLHLIWRANELNGKESPQGSFLKFTAHTFKKMLQREHPSKLIPFKIDAANKSHEFWQRDPMGILLYDQKIAYQKLDYIHTNPLAPHWNLAKDPCDYYYSSARFYEMNDMSFTFLKDLREEY